MRETWGSAPCKLAWHAVDGGELGAVWAAPMDLGLPGCAHAVLACCSRSGAYPHPGRSRSVTFDSRTLTPAQSQAQELPCCMRLKF